MRYPVRAALVLGLVAAALPTRAADAPAGIVMAVTGETDPKLATMQEVPANTAVTLTPGTQLTFLHYARCKLVTVSGGTLTLSRADYKVDGKIESEKDGPCPRIYALAGGSDGRSTGGIVARGVSSAPHWPVNPEFIFSGQRAGAVTAAAIFAEGKLDKPVMTLALAGWRASEPADAPRMVADGHYVLRLTMRDVTQSVDVPFVATLSTDPAPLVVVRVD
jgi:hypothetical protein